MVTLKPSTIAERTPPGTVLCAASKKNFGNAPMPLAFAVNGAPEKTGSLTVTLEHVREGRLRRGHTVGATDLNRATDGATVIDDQGAYAG